MKKATTRPKAQTVSFTVRLSMRAYDRLTGLWMRIPDPRPTLATFLRHLIEKATK